MRAGASGAESYFNPTRASNPTRSPARLSRPTILARVWQAQNPRNATCRLCAAAKSSDGLGDPWANFNPRGPCCNALSSVGWGRSVGIRLLAMASWRSSSLACTRSQALFRRCPGAHDISRLKATPHPPEALRHRFHDPDASLSTRLTQWWACLGGHLSWGYTEARSTPSGSGLDGAPRLRWEGSSKQCQQRAPEWEQLCRLLTSCRPATFLGSKL